MKRFLIYLHLETKKGMRLIPFFLVCALLTALFVSAAALLFSAFMGKRTLFPKAEIAIVLNSDGSDDSVESTGLGDLKTGMMIGLVESMSSVKSISHFSYMSPKEAAEALTQGTADAAVYLSKGVYQDINTGVNTPVLVRVSDKSTVLAGPLFRRLVRDGVSLIRTVETAIYSVDRLSESRPLADGLSLGEVEDIVFDTYVKAGLARTSVFTEESVSPFGNLSSADFYLVTGFVLILMLFGIGFSAFYGEGEEGAVSMLQRIGFPQAAAGAAKLISGTLTLAVMQAVLVFAAGLVRGMSLPEGFGAGDVLKAAADGAPGALAALPSSALPAILAAALSMAAFIHLVYSAAPPRYAPFVYLMVVAALFLLTGGLLPAPWMPALLKGAASLSPVGLWQSLASAALFMEGGGAAAAASAATAPASSAAWAAGAATAAACVCFAAAELVRAARSRVRR